MNVLPQRVEYIREGRPGRGPVAYWMSRDQRSADNWALLFAQETAIAHTLPLVVVFCLSDSFPGATLRQYGFMLRGLEKVSRSLGALSIPFFLLPGEPADTLPAFIKGHDISFLVADFDPHRVKRQWKEAVIRRTKVPVYEVDAHNIVPCRAASDKREYGAHTIRRKIRRLLPVFLDDMPVLQRHPWTSELKGDGVDAKTLLDTLRTDRSVEEVDWLTPGEDEAHIVLRSFTEEKLDRYETDRNDPVKDCQSNLSPYLHFGQISAQRVALEVRDCPAPIGAKDAFLEEHIVRRELADNYCLHTPNYDRFEAFPEWAKKTLNDHRPDRRPYLYSLRELENAETHDELWNAAQTQMAKTGKMHGYLRMYWAKKILEWTASPEEAISAAVCLNDRYELDGRDPNGYTGIAWSIGGVHDRPWGERNVFGKIRYMSYNGCASKFSVKRYIEAVRSGTRG
ncbi:MAG TPA: deoxyribodipyrimidine photo-lyase [Syntrophorhabdaceae bacterium]|nr:deoxyribodipyrimidine photo-lyase [Syntrophorhabdaceae bacterium]